MKPIFPRLSTKKGAPIFQGEKQGTIQSITEICAPLMGIRGVTLIQKIHHKSKRYEFSEANY
jgi:hypothetical protein